MVVFSYIWFGFDGCLSLTAVEVSEVIAVVVVVILANHDHGGGWWSTYVKKVSSCIDFILWRK